MPTLSCCVEGPPEAVPRLRYAVEELLRGLGRSAVWTRRVDARLYVGPEPEAAAPDALRIRVGALSFEALDAPGPSGGAGWLTFQGEQVPLPVGPGGTPVADPRHIVDADIVGSTFWWLTGAQEGAARASGGRFAYPASLQSTLGCATMPVVDRYREWLAAGFRALGEPIVPRRWGDAAWAVALTHDIDAVRTSRVRALLGDAARGHLLRGVRRATGPDWRWDSLVALRALARERGVRSSFFVKGGATAPQDVPYRLDDPDLVAFLRDLQQDGFEVGLHPSYGAADYPEHIVAERDRLAAVLGETPRMARMHYLRWTDPETPRELRRAGFRLDSTLGFSAREGFRRATSQPFRLYDAEREHASDVWEMPLHVMDTSLFTHLGLSPLEAEGRILAMLDEVRRAGGCLVLLWHNDMGEGEAWTRRLAVLDRAIGHAQREGAAVGPLGRLLADWGVRLSPPPRTPAP
jgi:hypothetical protein